MNPPTPVFSRLANWIRQHTAGSRIVQWINYIMIFSVLVVFIIEYPADRDVDWRFYTGVLALAILLVLNILWFQYHDEIHTIRKSTFFHLGFNLLTDALVLGTFALNGRQEVVFLVLMQVAMFASGFGIWPKGVMFGVLNLGIVMGIIKGLGATDIEMIRAGSQIMGGMVFVLVFVLLVDRAYRETRRAAELLQDLRAANLQLKNAHLKEKELAVVEERMRLARDIHDGLGHHLTVLSVQLQAAEKLVERSPQAAAEAIRISRAEAQAALEEVRQSVGMMRTSNDLRPLTEMLSSLAHDFGQHTGLPAHFEASGPDLELSPFARETLFRAAQEGLTNVQKHGRQVTGIDIRLEYAPDAVRLTLQDDGHPDPATPTGEAGFGLTGLRERVEQLGGALQSGPGPQGGFAIEVRIPLKESVA